jgi:hypothetical protein
MAMEPALEGSRVRSLQRLIDACTDDGRTLRRESRFVGEQARGVVLAAAAERRHFADALRDAAGGHLARARVGGSWPELLRELARSLGVAAGGPNRGDAIRACRCSSTRTEARYERALGLSWPDNVGPMLVDQRARIQQTRSDLTALQF